MNVVYLVILPSGDFHLTPWLGAVMQQAIAWANIDPDPCHHMAPLGNNVINLYLLIL